MHSIEQISALGQVLPHLYEPLIKVKRVPDSRGNDCEITLNIPWKIAEELAAVSGTVITKISQAVDIRSQEEKKREEERAKSDMQYQARRMRVLALLYQSLKRIHREGLHYHDFLKIFREQDLLSLGLRYTE